MGMILATLLCFDLQQEATAESSSQGQGAKRALLIGINKYKAVPKLQGSLNDIETMKQVLITRWGFPEGNIRFLTDEQATRDGMLAALNRFVKDTGPQDTVYIHYSGHGSQVEDLNGDEADDKLDETLVPQDGRTGSVPDITDDELAAILGKLPAKNAFVVLDSCHSGTATRSLDIRTRSIPQDTRVEIYRKMAETEVRTRGTIQLLPAQYVLMTGAAPHQEALDGPVNGRYHGFFSYALSKSLSSSSSTASPREIFRGIEMELKRIQTHFGRASMPEPQLEAPPDLLEQSLLGSTHNQAQPIGSNAGSRLAWIDVKPGGPGIVSLVNGVLLGATPGSIWSIYPPDDTTFTPGRALAIATVTQISGQDALARVHPANKKVLEHSRAVALMPAAAGEKLPIQVLDVPNARRKQIEETLQKHIPQVDLVGPEQFPQYLVNMKEDTIQLFAADGLQLVGSFAGEGDSWGAGLALVVSRSATANELLTLDNPSSQLKIDVRVANAPMPAKPKVSTRGISVVSADTKPARYRIRKPGNPRTQQNSLQLEVRVNADSYLTIVDVDSEGGVNLLFPNNYQSAGFHQDGFVRANEPVLIPDSIQSGNQAGFYWDYSPPKGTDTVRVFTSTDIQTAHMIRQRITALQPASAQTRGGVTTRTVSSAMKSLRQGLATRGIMLIADSTSHIPTTPGIVPSSDATLSPLPSEPIPASGAPMSDSPIPSAELVASSGSVVADWTAASITVAVSE
jgi:hypothetical protein